MALLLTVLVPLSFSLGQSETEASRAAIDAPLPDGALLPLALPAPAVALNPVPLSPPVAKPAPVVAKAAPAKVTPKAAPVKAAAKPAPVKTTARSAAQATIVLRATAYTSLRSQTDSSPFITATGARTRFGIVAVSRNLLRTMPYGSQVLLEDLGSWSSGRGRGAYNNTLRGIVFVVEDTMHPRKYDQIDVWFPAHRQAIQWGVRRVKVTVLQVGRKRV